mmetsp:Transcript_8921/g.16396  ORF Transcript_8921/g.16396 Transcript_8921/m.16396 type:complete len:242 (-) Transcript_8921:9-734(-)
MGCAHTSLVAPIDLLEVWIPTERTDVFRKVELGSRMEELKSFVKRCNSLCWRFKDSSNLELETNFGVNNLITGKRIKKGIYWDLFCKDLPKHLREVDFVLDHLQTQKSRSEKQKKMLNFRSSFLTLANDFYNESAILLESWGEMKKNLLKLRGAKGLIRLQYLSNSDTRSSSRQRSRSATPSRSIAKIRNSPKFSSTGTLEAKKSIHKKSPKVVVVHRGRSRSRNTPVVAFDETAWKPKKR